MVLSHLTGNYNQIKVDFSMKLKISTKINLLVISSLLLVGGVLIFFSASSLKSEGRLAMEEYRSAVMAEKHLEIRDLVNSAFAIAQERYNDSIDKDKLRKAYGSSVKDHVNQAVDVLKASHGNVSMGGL